MRNAARPRAASEWERLVRIVAGSETLVGAAALYPCHPDTLRRWLRQHPEQLRAAYETARDAASNARDRLWSRVSTGDVIELRELERQAAASCVRWVLAFAPYNLNEKDPTP